VSLLLIIGGIKLLVGYGILARMRAAQVVGIILAVVSAIAQVAHFTHYPAWAVIILVLDAIVVYALTVYSDEFATRRR
jgi:membrane-associated PAP2 superfamily phosphatase